MSNAASIRVSKPHFQMERDADGYTRVSGRDIQTIQTNLNQMTDTRPAAVQPHLAQVPTRRQISPAARKRIADAQRKRWAAAKSQTKAKPGAKTMTAGA